MRIKQLLPKREETDHTKMKFNLNCIKPCNLFNHYTSNTHTFNYGDCIEVTIRFCGINSKGELMYKISSILYDDEPQFKFVLSNKMIYRNFKIDVLLK